MKITFDIPDEFTIMAFTLVAPNVNGGNATHVFTHSLDTRDAESLRVEKTGKHQYDAVIVQKKEVDR